MKFTHTFALNYLDKEQHVYISNETAIKTRIKLTQNFKYKIKNTNVVKVKPT